MQKQDLQQYVQSQYDAINAKWLRFHLRLLTAYVIIILGIEVILSFVIYYTNNMNCTLPVYLLKYIVSPTILDGILVITGYLVFLNKRISVKTKQYVISILLAICSFVLSMIHSSFVMILAASVCPLLMTVMYEDQALTTITAAMSGVLQLFSGHLVFWNPAKVLDSMYMINVLIILIILLCTWLTCYIMIRFMKMKRKIIIQNDVERYVLQKKLVTDTLTHVGNKLALEKSLEKISILPQKAYYLAMLDVDCFKSINDHYGHIVGDEVLQIVGQALRDIPLKCDAFRYGGDEFCILFTDCTEKMITMALQDMQQNIRNCRVEAEESVSISIGVAKYQSGFPVSQLIHQADKAMYMSKRKDGNTITFA